MYTGSHDLLKTQSKTKARTEWEQWRTEQEQLNMQSVPSRYYLHLLSAGRHFFHLNLSCEHADWKMFAMQKAFVSEWQWPFELWGLVWWVGRFLSYRVFEASELVVCLGFPDTNPFWEMLSHPKFQGGGSKDKFDNFQTCIKYPSGRSAVPGGRPSLPSCTFPHCVPTLVTAGQAGHLPHRYSGRTLPGPNQRGCRPPLLQWSGRGLAAAAPQAPMLTRRDAPGWASSSPPVLPPPRPPTINLKYSQAGLQLRRQGLSRISEALERKGSIWWPVPSCCSKDLLNNPGWIADPVVSRRLYKSGLEWQWQSYLASSLQNIA